MKILVLTKLMLLTVANFCLGEDTPALSDVRLEVDYGHDTMQTVSRPHVDSVESIPKKLRIATEVHLKRRLGENYSKLTFSRLWKIDEPRLLKKAYPDAGSLDGRFFFHLEYLVDFEDIGLKECRVFIRIRDDWTVFEDVRLPREAKNWATVHIKKVFDKGVGKLKRGKAYGVDFLFDDKSDRMQWVIESHSSITGTVEIRQAFFDSISGEFLRVGSQTVDGF